MVLTIESCWTDDLELVGSTLKRLFSENAALYEAVFFFFVV